MQSRLQITFRNLLPSEAIESKIRQRVQKLDSVCGQIISCRVLVETPHAHHHKGNLFQVRVDLSVPGRAIVVSRAADSNHAHEDAYIAIRDAFDAVMRQLEDHVRRQRGDVKTHTLEADRGKISPDPVA